MKILALLASTILALGFSACGTTPKSAQKKDAACCGSAECKVGSPHCKAKAKAS